MASLFGKEYTKQELLRHVGRMDQVGGVRKVVLDEGKEKGAEAVLFRTGSGLNFTAVAGRALDISAAEYCGQSLCWRGPVGDVEASYFEPDGLGWLRTFSGGLVTTCGLTYAGAPHTDSDTGEGAPYSYMDKNGNLQWSADGSIGLHGRIGCTPAEHLAMCEWWEGNDYWMSVSGQMREAKLFGPNIVLKRTVRAKLGESKIWIDDMVENQAFTPQEHMFVYHCNLGFPVISEGAEYLINSSQITPRDKDAAPHVSTWKEFPGPTPNQVEWVYYHDLATDSDNNTSVAVANRDFNGSQGFGAYLKFNKKQLPEFIQWKMPGEGDYVTGMEPANCRVEGRVKDRTEGRLVVLQPGESCSYSLEIGVLACNEEIDKIAEYIDALS